MGIHTITPAFKGQECINKLQQKNTAQKSTLLPSCFFFDSLKLVEGVWSWSINLLPIFNKVQCNDKACCNKLHITKTMGRYMRSLLDTNFQFLHHLIFLLLSSKYSCTLLILEKKTMFVLPTSNYKLKQNQHKKLPREAEKFCGWLNCTIWSPRASETKKIYYHNYKQQEMTQHQECSYLLTLSCLTMST